LIARLRRLLANPTTEWVIAGLIVVNALILGLETSPTAMSAAGALLIALDRAILAFFVVEIAARIAVHRLAFFRDPWSVFDFIVIGISLLLILVFYVFSVMATQLYGTDFPELFGDLGASAFTLFAVMTLEGWVDGVVKPVMEKYPYAWLFFIPYILITTFAVLNLFIAVIAMQTEHEQSRKEEELQHQDEQRKLGTIRAKEEDILEELRALRAEVKALRERTS
jgi:voltage-gated sodium channel